MPKRDAALAKAIEDIGDGHIDSSSGLAQKFMRELSKHEKSEFKKPSNDAKEKQRREWADKQLK
eukprot:5682913-Pyramimonas_sp.AAC.1